MYIPDGDVVTDIPWNLFIIDVDALGNEPVTQYIIPELLHGVIFILLHCLLDHFHVPANIPL